jgi:hypothetical protein
MSLDFANLDFTEKRSEIERLNLQTRQFKTELSRLHWEDFREVKQIINTQRREVEVSELQYSHRKETAFKSNQDRLKQDQLQAHRAWLATQAEDNRHAKQISTAAALHRKQDDLTRSQSSILLSTHFKDRLKTVQRQEAENKRQSCLNDFELQCQEQAKQAEEERQELLNEAKRRVDEMFERALQENQETLASLITAKYSRRPE